ncbi:NAC domain-containing protein 68-like [Chenopodium quinoa]|uniref:NAC domain-containing protein 68-like n=1 Tax=Chenopodium quinoa TaxID=63459 RepID=UPI000B773822|nr:NAC domain-containing protein 68-like [Chenopodium quinoa]
MALRNPNSVFSNRLMVGFIFQPSITEIFSYFLPQRLLVGQPVLPSPYDTNVKDIDLYGEMSPQQLFDHQSTSDETEFYFFTTLKKQSESNKRVKRVAGGGTWDGDRYEECKMVVQGNMVKVGVKKSFKFKKSKKDECDNNVSWILHEYKMDKDYYVNTYNNGNNINPNVVDNIVFCHVHKKVEKNFIEMDKKRKESFNCEEQRKRICNENKNLESGKILDNNPPTQKMDNNNINESTSVESSIIINNNASLNNGYDNKGGDDGDIQNVLMNIKYEDDLNFDWDSYLQVSLDDHQTTNEDRDGVSLEELTKSQDDTQLFPNSTTTNVSDPLLDYWWSIFLQNNNV